MPRERPADEGIGVAVAHAEFGLEITHDSHVLFDMTLLDDLLPLPNGSAVLLFNRWKI